MAMQKVGLHAVAATASVQQQMTRAGTPFNRVWQRDRRYPGATFFVFASCLLAGCGGKPEVPVGDAAEKIRKLALAYVEYASTNNGRGPADKEALAKFLQRQNQISTEEADAFFVSPRDNQPYIIRWGETPMGQPVGGRPPKPNIIIFENTGADGTRYVADGRLSVKELSEEAFSQAVPDHDPSSE